MQGFEYQTKNEEEQGRTDAFDQIFENIDQMNCPVPTKAKKSLSNPDRKVINDKQFETFRQGLKNAGWQTIELPQLDDISHGRENVFECKCATKLHSPSDIEEHFKSCYQMFLVYGNFMKSFTALKEAATETTQLQINLYLLLKQFMQQAEQSFSVIKSFMSHYDRASPSRTSQNSNTRLQVPLNYSAQSPISLPKLETDQNIQMQKMFTAKSQKSQQISVSALQNELESRDELPEDEVNHAIAPDFLHTLVNQSRNVMSDKSLSNHENLSQEEDHKFNLNTQTRKTRPSVRKARSGTQTPTSVDLIRQFKPKLEMEGGATYEGEWANNKRDGKGKQTWPDGSSYDGEWQAGKMQGQGTYTYANGNQYTGQWMRDRKHGKGTFKHASGTQYTGDWVADKEHGFGQNIWPNGSSYEGGYSEGCKHGTGKLVYKNGDIYEGQISKNVLQGTGTFIWKTSGKQYTGQWDNNRMHGKGHMKYKDGKEYIGDYFEDQRHGQGLYKFGDEREYEGGWVKGKQHGVGFYKDRGSTHRQGLWENGKRIKWADQE